MAGQDAKAIARRTFEEIWNREDPEAVEDLFAADFVSHTSEAGFPPDREGFKQWVAAVVDAFPDVRFAVEQVIAEGDWVVVRWTASGTHQKDFMGVPATNRRAQVDGLGMSRIEEGKIKESWTRWDALGLLQQLGAIPASE